MGTLARHSQYPHNPFHVGRSFRGYTGSQLLRPARLLASLVGSDWNTCPATGGFYVQAFDGAVTLTVAGYDYDIDWTPMSAGHTPAGMAATGRHARLGSRLLARLCRGRHRRRQTSTRLQGATRTDPCEPNSGTRLPPRVSNGEASLWPRMKDSRFREPVVGQPLDPLPGRPVFLAPLP